LLTADIRYKGFVKMEIRIREAAQKDKEIIESIIKNNAIFTDEEKYCAAELLDFYLRDITKDEYLFLCAVDESDKPLGYICYGKTPFAEGVYDIYWIVIAPEWQGKRVGKMLIRHVENILKNGGVRMIFAETSSQPKYDKTRLFYEKVEFEEVSRLKDFYRVGDDKVIYVKRIGESEN